MDRNRLIPAIISIFIICFLFSLSVQADIYMKQRQKTEGAQMMGMGQGPGETIQTIWISKNKIRSDNEKQSVLILLDQQKMYFIDHSEKVYREMSMDMAKNMKEKAEKSVSKEDMKRMQEMMGQSMGDMKISVTKTDETKKINDWDCRKYIQEMSTMMGPVTSEIWATDELEMDYDVLSTFRAATMSMQPGAQGSMGEMIEELEKIKGVPVYTVTNAKMMNMNMKTTQELLEFKNGDAPAGTYEIPAGYEKK